MVLALLAAVLCMRASAQQVTPENPFVVSTCDLLGDMPKWNGRLIQVHGDYRQGTLSLWADCPTRIIVKGHTFVNLIALADPAELRLAVHRVDFTRDDRSWRRFIEATYSASAHESLKMTVVGVFETRAIKEQLVFDDGVLFGFGEQNLAPAQVLVREIKDLTLGP